MEKNKKISLDMRILDFTLAWSLITQCLTWAGIIDFSWIAIWLPFFISFGICFIGAFIGRVIYRIIEAS